MQAAIYLHFIHLFVKFFLNLQIFSFSRFLPERMVGFFPHAVIFLVYDQERVLENLKTVHPR